MTKLAICAVAVTLAAGPVLPAKAAPPPTGPVGEKCALFRAPELFVEDGWQGGDMRAGPLYTGEPGTLTCAIHVNNNDHSGQVAASASFSATNGVVQGSVRVAYQATDADSVALCTTWSGASGTLYWSAPNPAVPTDSGTWSSSPTSCGELVRVDPIMPLPTPPVGPQCADGIDNDGDGRADYPADYDCDNALDSEAPPSGSCTSVGGVPVCASYTPGTQRTPYTVSGPATAGTPVTGYVDVYEFTLPNGGTVTLPCVVLSTANGCAAAGGRYVSRTATLGPATAPVPTGSLVPLATVYVCDANLVLTVNGFGITSFPAYAVC